MRSRTDLYLLRDAIDQLDETTYFSKRLHVFTTRIVGVIDFVLEIRSTRAERRDWRSRQRDKEVRLWQSSP